MKDNFRFRLSLQVACVVAGLAGVVLTARPAATQIANEPLAQAASSVKPNIMFILDASGSMGQDYTPDYINDSGSGASCFDSGDNGNSILDSPNPCAFGDPPYNAPDFNTQYYNPEIFYRPGANFDGTDKTNQDCVNTGGTLSGGVCDSNGWTAVQSDPYLSAGSTTNLRTGYNDRVWCTDQADSATDTTLCKTNNAYSYPDGVQLYGLTTGGSIKYRQANPYYYRIQPRFFCSDVDLTNCTASAVATGTYVFPAPVRHCTDATYTNCQRKRLGSFTIPRYLGTASGVAATQGVGSIVVGATPSTSSANIQSLTINGQALLSPTYSNSGYGSGVSITNGVITATSGTTTSTTRNNVAQAITDGINAYTATSGFIATRSSATVTLKTSTNTSSFNGYSPITVSTVSGTTAATGLINVAQVGSSYAITSIKVNGVQIHASTINCNYGTNNSTNRTACAAAIVTAIGSSLGAAYVSTPDYKASNSGSAVTITANAAAGTGPNGFTILVTATSSMMNFSGASCSPTNSMCGGASSGNLPLTLTSVQNGNAVSTIARINVGQFARTDIKPSVTSYTKAPTRIDCAGSDCTYDEEMTNFSNWYAYYRTRILMMKSAAGRAFIPIDDTFRVGFITINPGSTVSSSKYLRIDDFTGGSGGHKDLWYTKFYSQTVGLSTPNREAISRVGQLFAGKFGSSFLTNGIPSADDPVTVSCQPNFAILTTDGYWNGNGGKKLDNTAMTDQDGIADSGFSKRSDGVYDGHAAGDTLSDAALYYYITDLRPAGTKNVALNVDVSADNVPQTQLDSASHQHMVLFTLGLGLDGALTFDQNYADPTLTSGDFYRIKNGFSTCLSTGGNVGTSMCNWPVPVGDTPTALDDLWHAAVNGRGLFFSARNPEELAKSLSDTLSSMRTRVGAGAAAATSNLQPVAGDNFAFTAQYQTVSWTGDLKSRTIDLSSGIVSSVQLWSAQTLLDNKNYTTRVIYTLDAADTAGNRLRHFCWNGEGGTTCSDGSGFTSAEMTSYFDFTQLVQYNSLLQPQKDALTQEKLVDFVRGDTSNENTGNNADSDVFRNRQNVLGDIVAAQPAYVRNSPFNFTDPGYQGFKKCTEGTGSGCNTSQFPNASIRRKPTVYGAANDGMLHAFEVDVNNSPYYQTAGISTPTTVDDTFSAGNNAGNGDERWAYIPALVLPQIRKLANDPYQHRFYTDGSPTVSDICISTPCAGQDDWRTILVAGLNAGGAGFYALDITNPDAPKALWEFGVGATCRTDIQIAAAPGTFLTDCNVGLSFGNPIVTKRKSDGKWVVLVTSGYNNCSPGDGKGYLYILDAVTGGILNRIGTGVGTGGSDAACTGGTPSGLARINVWIDDSSTNNTALTAYGGDLLGNLWRFDLDSSHASTYLTAVAMATLKDKNGVAQPVTTKPEVGDAFGYRVVLVGTGRFLGTSDKSDTTSLNTLYALREDGSATAITRADLEEQKLVVDTTNANVRTSDTTTTHPMNWDTKKGWFIDLPESGERVSVDPQLQLGTLVVASNIPNSDTCSAGGSAWVNFIDVKTGRYVAANNNTMASQKIAASLVVGINVIQLPGGAVKTIVTTADNQQLTNATPVSILTFGGNRISWRELMNDR